MNCGYSDLKSWLSILYIPASMVLSIMTVRG